MSELRRTQSSVDTGEPQAAGTTPGLQDPLDLTAPREPGELKSDTTAVARVGGEVVAQASLLSDAWRQLRRSKVFLVAATLLFVLAVMAAFPQLFTNADPRQCDLSNSRQGPGTNGAWFGYDLQGCDYYANVVYGARVSMIIGVVVAAGSLFVGVILGSLSGYFGGWFDSLVARITDVAFGIPTILGSILILNAFSRRSLFAVSVALIALGWMTVLRLLRSSVIAVKSTDYVAAARALGASDRRIIMTHILPNALTPVFVYSTIAIGGIIAAEATLSFLGIGLQRPSISWGLQINQAQQFIRVSPHLLFFPSAFLSLTVLCFILIGDALRDALDPKLR